VPRHIRFAVAVSSIALMAVACRGAVGTAELQGVIVESPSEKASFTLTDTEGDAFDFRAETDGELTLLYFGYLNCPDICPVHLAQIAEVFDQLPAVARDTNVVFVSVDPNRDSPEAIRRYLDNFDRRFIGLTGTLDELRDAQTAAGVPLAQYVGDGENYTVDHAGWVIAYGPDDVNHVIYPSGTRQSQLLNDLPALAKLGT